MVRRDNLFTYGYFFEDSCLSIICHGLGILPRCLTFEGTSSFCSSFFFLLSLAIFIDFVRLFVFLCVVCDFWMRACVFLGSAQVARFHAARRARLVAGTAREHAGRLLPATVDDSGGGAAARFGNGSGAVGCRGGGFRGGTCGGRGARTGGVRAERMIRYVRQNLENPFVKKFL
jgi:hypothetical protein